jgi:hypothetical protein
MKPLLYSSLYFILLSLQTFKLFAQEANTELLSVECEIVKIDSIGNYYVIYAKNISEKYKIVSEKSNTICQNIVVGLFYKITLEPLIRSMNMVPVVFSDGAAIIPYGWGKTLYFPLEIRGLYYNVEFAIDILKKRKAREEQENLKFKNKRAEEKYFKKRFKEEMGKIGNTLYYEKEPLIDDE